MSRASPLPSLAGLKTCLDLSPGGSVYLPATILANKRNTCDSLLVKTQRCCFTFSLMYIACIALIRKHEPCSKRMPYALRAYL